MRGLLERIIERLHPVQIWLFGSRARGDARATSDWDLLVVLPDDADAAALDPVALWHLQRDQPVRADVVACYRRDFDEDRTTPNTLAFEAWNHGVLVHEQ